MNEELPEAPPPERPRTRRNRNAWWAEQWTEPLLENTAPERRQRGRLLARTGSVFGFRVEPGRVRADVRPARGELHEVSLEIPRFGMAEQTSVLDCAAAKARFLAELLHGVMDVELHLFLCSAGVRLLPDPAEVTLRCSCADPIPCAHAAALLATLEERLGRNPFLLFRIRGVLRETLLEGCQVRRQASSVLAQSLVSEAAGIVGGGSLVGSAGVGTVGGGAGIGVVVESAGIGAVVGSSGVVEGSGVVGDAALIGGAGVVRGGDVVGEGGVVRGGIDVGQPGLAEGGDPAVESPTADRWWGNQEAIDAVKIPASTAVVQTVLVELGFPARIDHDSDAAQLLEDAYTIAMDMEIDGHES